MPSSGLVSDFKAHVRSLREFSSILFALEVVRVLALGALLGLSIYAAVQAEPPSSERLTDGSMVEECSKWGRKKHNNKHHKSQPGWDDYSHLEWEEFGVCGFYVSVTYLPLTDG